MHIYNWLTKCFAPIGKVSFDDAGPKKVKVKKAAADEEEEEEPEPEPTAPAEEAKPEEGEYFVT